MQLPNPVQPIQQQMQRFAQPQVQPQPMIMGGAPQQPISAEAAIQQQMHELAIDIYARAAADYLPDADDDRLRELATGSQRAARAFFESMGVQFSE